MNLFGILKNLFAWSEPYEPVKRTKNDRKFTKGRAGKVRRAGSSTKSSIGIYKSNGLAARKPFLFS